MKTFWVIGISLLLSSLSTRAAGLDTLAVVEWSDGRLLMEADSCAILLDELPGLIKWGAYTGETPECIPKADSSPLFTLDITDIVPPKIKRLTPLNFLEYGDTFLGPNCANSSFFLADILPYGHYSRIVNYNVLLASGICQSVTNGQEQVRDILYLSGKGKVKHVVTIVSDHLVFNKFGYDGRYRFTTLARSQKYYGAYSVQAFRCRSWSDYQKDNQQIFDLIAIDHLEKIEGIEKRTSAIAFSSIKSISLDTIQKLQDDVQLIANEIYPLVNKYFYNLPEKEQLKSPLGVLYRLYYFRLDSLVQQIGSMKCSVEYKLGIRDVNSCFMWL